MNPNTKTALGIGGVVVLAAALSAGLFVVTTSRAATWFVLVGIPVTVIGGVALYVRGVVARSGTSEAQYVRTRANAVAQEFQETVREVNDVRDSYPAWNPGVDAQLESVAGDLRSQGVSFDLDSGAFDLSKTVKSADLQEFEQASAEIERIDETVENSVRTFANDELTAIEDCLERLEDVDLVRLDRLPATPPAEATVAECRDAIDDARSAADAAIEEAIGTVREMGRGDTRPDDVEAIERELTTATDAADRHEYHEAVDSILEARDRLRDQFSGSFDVERDAVLNLVDAVDATGVDEHVDAEYISQVETVESAVTGLGSALELSELSRHRSQLRRACVDIIATLERELQDDIRTLRRAELPAGYYTEPAIADETFVDELDAIDGLDAFTDRWTDIAYRLVDAVADASTKAAVVDAYDDVSATIERELETTGSVTDADLPVRHADQFLGLYYRQNPSVEFDPDVPSLRVGDVETYDIAVEVTYERGGPIRMATLELSGAGYEATTTVETRITETVTFEDVPAGGLTLVADPGDDAFSPIEREFRVDGDETVRIEFTEQSLRERVCSDVGAEIDEIVPEMSPRLDALFEDEGYVSTTMELPVRATHAPCLVAAWAEQAGYAATQDGADVVAFDRDRLEREVTNVVRYNLEPGDRLTYDELERNFLSAPVPSAVIRNLVGELETEHNVQTTETAIEVK